MTTHQTLANSIRKRLSAALALTVAVALVVPIGYLGAGAGPAHAADDVPPEAPAVLTPFKQQLMGALKQGLAAGPAAAIDACRLEAPAIAAGLTTASVQLGRTSHRLRNPRNAGPEWAESVLADYLAQSGDWKARVVDLPGGRLGYVEPIVTQPLCLACHGDHLDDSVSKALAEHYPEDQATGFAVGDLRGVFWVNFEPEPSSP